MLLAQNSPVVANIQHTRHGQIYGKDYNGKICIKAGYYISVSWLPLWTIILFVESIIYAVYYPCHDSPYKLHILASKLVIFTMILQWFC